jgi:hypothetical protein
VYNDKLGDPAVFVAEAAVTLEEVKDLEIKVALWFLVLVMAARSQDGNIRLVVMAVVVIEADVNLKPKRNMVSFVLVLAPFVIDAFCLKMSRKRETICNGGRCAVLMDASC